MPLTPPEILRTLLAARTRLLAAAWTVVGDVHLAEDIFQTVSVKALEPDVTFVSDAALLSWAHVVARREGLQWLRRHKRESVGLEIDVLDLLDAEWHATGSAAPARMAAALTECLETIPPQSRRLLELRYFEGHACDQVASALGCGLDAVYQRLSRLHRALRTCIEQRLDREEFSPGPS